MKLVRAVISIVIFTQVAAFAQDVSLYDEPGIIGSVDTSTVIYSWTLDRCYIDLERVEVDTNLETFQVRNPALQNYTTVSTLGNYSLPTISNLFTERERDQEFILVNTYYPFMKHFWNTTYINTRKPFTNLTYLSGGSGLNKEELLDAFHSQNISGILNAGFHLTTSRALGQYRFQKTKNNSFKLFSSYSGSTYSYHFNININKIIADENGGIYDDASITDTVYAYTKDIPTLFGGVDNPPTHNPDAYREIRNINTFMIHELALRSAGLQSDSIDKRRFSFFNPALAYIFYLDRTINLFNDKDPSAGYQGGLYRDILINENTTMDSLYYWKLYNGLRIKFQGRQQNRYFIDYAYDLMHYSMVIPSMNPEADTLLRHWFISQEIKLPSINYNNNIYNSHISSGFSRIFANRIEMDLFGRYYLSGYRKGDLHLSGNLKFFLSRSRTGNHLNIGAVNEIKTPDFLYTHYASNNFIWTNNFKRTVLNHLSIILSISSKKFEFKGDYYLLRDFIFLNRDALPEQYHNNLSVLVISLARRFDFWKVTTDNILAFQKVSNGSVLGLPEMVANSSTYLTHLFNFRTTGGKLLTMIGFDLKYNTKYYADAYMPPLASFYRQNEKKLGNYPYFDVFLNIQLKRLRFFLKLDHVNSGWIDRNYFTVLHYPMNERSLKFGLSWTFYD
ncbi:MAG: hypothetical protein JXB19_11930 [Bacteroidales bacterium]|nr:hypothetical protein [Bacteroidales bacterium]